MKVTQKVSAEQYFTSGNVIPIVSVFWKHTVATKTETDSGNSKKI